MDKKKASKQSLTYKEAKKLAMEIYTGSVFTDRHIRSSDHGDPMLMTCIFMPLVFMSKEQIEEMKDVGMIYEYMSQAGSRSINGYPIFSSFRRLSKQDTDKVMQLYREICQELDDVPPSAPETLDEEESENII